MSNTLWDPLSTREMEIASQESRTCCGRTIKGAFCRNQIKLPVIQKGHQKLRSLARRPLDLATLELSLRDIARSFLCARWHQSQQSDTYAHKWYQVALRNMTRLTPSTRPSQQPIVPSSLSSRPRQLSERHHPGHLQLDGSRLDAPDTPVYSPSANAPSPSIGSFVTGKTLRSNNVPWQVSPE